MSSRLQRDRWNLEMIHDHDFLNLSLGKNCEDLASDARGYENHGSAGITQEAQEVAALASTHREGRRPLPAPGAGFNPRPRRVSGGTGRVGRLIRPFCCEEETSP